MPSIKNHLFMYGLVLLQSLLHAQQDTRLPGLVVEQISRLNTGKVKYLSGVEGNRTGSDIKDRSRPSLHCKHRACHSCPEGAGQHPSFEVSC
ncbi:MAG: hypothetical protein RLZZ165_2409 [Bacteroidota bacterium]